MSLEVLPEPPGRYTTTSSGLRFHYHELAATIATDAGEEPGAGPSEPLEPAAAGAPVAARVPAVFLHGGGPGCTAWTDFGQVGRLFSRDRRCLLVDLLQYGKTDKPTIDGPMWDFHAREYTALLDAWGIERADFVCNSWGGGAALNLAATAPERVNRLAITGAMPVFYGPLAPLPERAARGRNARDAYYGGTGPSREKMRQLMARLEWFDATRIPELTIDMRYEQSISAEERQINDAPSRRGEWQDLTDRLGAVRAPTLFCWGMHDAFLTPDYPLMLASRLERGHLYVMDRASHHLQEERPEDYHRIVAAFLDQGGQT